MEGGFLLTLLHALAYNDASPAAGRAQRREGVLRVLTEQLRRRPPVARAVFSAIFTALAGLVDRAHAHTPGDGAAGPPNDELLVAAWGCLEALLVLPTDGSIEVSAHYLRHVGARLQLGHVVSVALDGTLRPADNRQCRRAALAALLALWRTIDDGDTLGCFFPGVVSGLGRLVAACGELRQGHVLTSEGVAGLFEIVVATVGDAACETAGMAAALRAKTTPTIDDLLAAVGNGGKGVQSVLPSPEQDSVEETDEPSSVPTVVRHRRWLDELVARLAQLLPVALNSPCKHRHPKVRAAVATAAGQLLCKASLVLALPLASGLKELLTDMLVGALYDESEDVRSAAVAETSELLPQRRGADPWATLTRQTAQERLNRIACRELPKAMREVDDAAKLPPLQRLAGYMRCMAAGSLSMPIAKQVVRALLRAVELASHAAAIEANLHEYRALDLASGKGGASVVSGNLPTVGLRPRWPRRYRHFSDESVERGLCRGCQELLRASSFEIFLDQVLSVLSTEVSSERTEAGAVQREAPSGLKPAQALVLLSYALSDTDASLEEQAESMASGAPALADCIEQHADWILDELLQPAVWETDAGQRLGAVYTFDAQREAITTASLAVECVGCLALRVGGSAFAPLLLRVIYPLLERVSDPAAEVGDAALRALQDVATAMGCDSRGGPSKMIARLLEENMDYIVDAVASRMRHLHEHPQTPSVLAAVLRFTGPEIIPLIDDTVDLLFDGLDIGLDRAVVDFYRIQRSIVTELLQDQLARKKGHTLGDSSAETQDSIGPGGGQGSLATPLDEPAVLETKPTETSVEEDSLSLQQFIAGHFDWLGDLSTDHLEPDSEPADDGDAPEPEEPEEPEPEPEPEPALAAVDEIGLKLVVQLLDRSQHFIGRHAPQIQLVLCETFALCLRYLANLDPAPNDTVYLPAIATLWPAFCRYMHFDPHRGGGGGAAAAPRHRAFADATTHNIGRSVIAAPAFVAAVAVLVEMGKTCGSFIARRFHDEAWPGLRRVLVAGTASLLPAGGRAAHFSLDHSHHYKAVAATIDCLAELAAPGLGVFAGGGERVTAVAMAAYPFLSAQNPPPLQERAVELFRQLAAADSDAVWLVVAGLADLPSAWLTPLAAPVHAHPFRQFDDQRTIRQVCRVALPKDARELQQYQHNCRAVLEAIGRG